MFERTGDGLDAVFANPAAALRAAADLQRAMTAERWGEVGTFRIRVALHSGTAQLREGDYFGPTLNRSLASWTSVTAADPGHGLRRSGSCRTHRCSI